jgi:RNA polymerase sigma factor (sigma-70 family)
MDWINYAYRVAHTRTSHVLRSPDDDGLVWIAITNLRRRHDPDRAPFAAYLWQHLGHALTDLHRVEHGRAENLKGAPGAGRLRGRNPSGRHTQRFIDYYDPHDPAAPLYHAAADEDDTAKVDDRLDLAAQVARLHTLLDALPAPERDVVVGTIVHGYRFHEVAAMYGVSESRMCQLRTQALGRLRRELEAA